MRNKFEKWEKIRAKGKWNYILLDGVLGWGVSTAVLFSVIFPLIDGKQSFLHVFALSIFLFPLGGIAWGYFMWMFIEKAYEKAKISEQPHASDAGKPRR